jgi:hypothetical protein
MYSCSTLFSKYSRRYMAFENVYLSSDNIERSQLRSNETDSDFCHQSPTYAVSSVYFNHTLISYVHWTWKCLISVRKLHDLSFILCYKLNSVHVNLLFISSVFVIILYSTCSHLSFCHIFGTSKILSLN